MVHEGATEYNFVEEVLYPYFIAHNQKFLPYIQLHEFEALLFSDPKKLEAWLSLDHPVPTPSGDNPKRRYYQYQSFSSFFFKERCIIIQLIIKDENSNIIVFSIPIS
jgi:hypothetical protein